MSSTYSIQDQVAIVGLGYTPYLRDSQKTTMGLVADAARMAIRDAGLTAKDINGLAGPQLRADLVQGALGIPEVTYFLQTTLPPFFQQLFAAMHAVHAGICDTALVYHVAYVGAHNSRAAAADPFRRPRGGGFGGGLKQGAPWPDSIAGTACYATWANRYLHEYNRTREDFGYVAINNRTNASVNEHAIQREPMTMDDYLSARMVRDPLGIYDMDFPIDGAEAVVVTTAERAKDMAKRPVFLHAASEGQTDHAVEEEMPDLAHQGQQVCVKNLWERTDLSIDDIDLFQPYDGFSPMSLSWLEVFYCGLGEGGAFMADNWNKEKNRLEIGGRVLMNTHGGSLSDGASQGAGHTREAILQLRGEAGARQVEGVERALVCPGGYFFNAGAYILRV
ncbi:MAG: thiolase family protein [Acidimicrobiia bacterium]